MSYPPPALGEFGIHPTITTGDGPAAHEDLTIAEQLETMRVPGEHRPGEQCFLNPNGENRWIGDTEVKRFVSAYGADHPSDYLTTHGTDWQKSFFNGN